MSKQNEEQMDLFPVRPEITGLGITKFETKGAEIVASLKGVTNVSDIALLTDDTWKNAVAEWLVMLCGGDELEIHNLTSIASVRVADAMAEVILERESQH